LNNSEFVVILSVAALPAERRISLSTGSWFGRSLDPLKKTRAFGMTGVLEFKLIHTAHW
jgi:hypothetical protein